MMNVRKVQLPSDSEDRGAKHEVRSLQTSIEYRECLTSSRFIAKPQPAFSNRASDKTSVARIFPILCGLTRLSTTSMEKKMSTHKTQLILLRRFGECGLDRLLSMNFIRLLLQYADQRPSL